jgi:alcohol dehydrogenase
MKKVAGKRPVGKPGNAASAPEPRPTGCEELEPFDHQLRTRLVFGAGCVNHVGALARGLGFKKVLLVTDPGIVKAGHAERVLKLLSAEKLKVVLYGGVRENPTTGDVDRCLEVARKAGIDSIVGLGGGSSMDTAKGCNFLFSNGGKIRQYWGVGKARKPMLPLIAIPTTAGTGSECQSFAIISDEDTHQKMACGDPKASARVAILDPELTMSQPLRVTSCTGIDAIAHAVETAVTTRRTELSMMYSHRAFKLLIKNFPVVLKSPDNLSARAGMLLGAAMAGIAIENSMLGAAHAAANPLTARHGIIHGQAVGMMLPSVVRFNAGDKNAARGYAELVAEAGITGESSSAGKAASTLAARLELLANLAGFPRSLQGCGIERSAIEGLAKEAAGQWTAGFNPRPLTQRDFEKLYEAAFRERGGATS